MLNWEKLKERRCPKCNFVLEKSFKWFCSGNCGFFISKGKFFEITGGRSQNLQQQANNILKKYGNTKKLPRK